MIVSYSTLFGRNGLNEFWSHARSRKVHIWPKWYGRNGLYCFQRFRFQRERAYGWRKKYALARKTLLHFYALLAQKKKRNRNRNRRTNNRVSSNMHFGLNLFRRWTCIYMHQWQFSQNPETAMHAPVARLALNQKVESRNRVCIPEKRNQKTE